MKNSSRFVLCSAIAIASTALTASAQTYVRFTNRWTQGAINNEHGAPQASPVEAGWFSAMWVVETAPNQSFVRLRNRWTNGYLNIENDAQGGTTQVGQLPVNYATSWWSFEPVPGTQFVRIKNAWTNNYLNVEHGALKVTAIEPGWYSAMWTTDNVAAAQPVYTPPPPPVYRPPVRDVHQDTAYHYQVTVNNEGGYVAKYYLTYTGVDGVRKTVASNNTSLGFGVAFDVLALGTDVQVRGEYVTAFGNKQIFNIQAPSNQADPLKPCLKTYGTIFDAKWSACN